MQRQPAPAISILSSFLRISFLAVFLLTLNACGSGAGAETNTSSSAGTTPGGGTGGGGGTDNGGGSTNNPPIAVYGGSMLKTDGTANGTGPVYANTNPPFSFPYGFTELNGEFYFHANTSANGFELWKTDGTPTGTLLVKDINPGAGSAFHYRFADFTAYNGALYFQADDGVNGFELWKTDGTVAGTVLVKDINPTPGIGSTPSDFTVFNGSLYFTASDSVNGRKLWKTNGTAADTSPVMDMNIITGSSFLPDDFSRGFPVLNGALYFIGNGVWRTDGTDAGTVLVGDNTSVKWATKLTNGFAVLNGGLYFQADENNLNNLELYKTDGTPTNMVLVKDINTENGGRRSDYLFSQFTVFNGALYFQSKDNVNGPRFWKTDGTTDGTVLVKNFGIQIIKAAPNALYFAGGPALWKTDGTVDGTVMVKNYSP